MKHAHFALWVLWACFCGCNSGTKIPAEPTTANAPSADSLLASNARFQLLKEIPIRGKLLATDALMNSYVVTKDNEVVKYSPEGEELYRYGNFRMGDIGYISARDPFNLLILYQENQVVEILDERLDPNSSFDLFQSEAPRVRVAALSQFPGQVWIYDEANFRLKRLDSSGAVVFESVDLSYILGGRSGKDFSFLLEKGRIFLGEAGGKMYLFDEMGNYIRTEDYGIPSGKMQVWSKPETHVFRHGRRFTLTNPKAGSLQTQEIILPENCADAIAAEIQQDHIMVLQPEKLTIHTFVMEKGE